MDLSSDEFLELLRDAQATGRPRSGTSFEEWRQEQSRMQKSPASFAGMAHVAPGFGMMGAMGTSSRAPAGPRNRSSGNPGLGWKPNSSRQPYDKPRSNEDSRFMDMQFGVQAGVEGSQPSKYDFLRPNQPPPWIDDVNMESIWYSPFEPVWPFGPPFYTTPREWNFPVGYNLNYVQQRQEMMGMLRGMRDSWGVLATVIETRKDQLLRLPWTIQVKGKPRANSKAVDRVRRFFHRPDGKMTYSQWARRYLDDLFVLDAPTVFNQRSLTGQTIQAQLLDGATIFPLIDDVGRRPDTSYVQTEEGTYYQHRQPAFQQIIYGLPMINLSEDEIIYGMMRPKPEMPVFGYSPVQQIFTEATEAIRKTFYQLEFWRAGSMPELIVTVPDNWSPRQIATFQAHFDAVLSGQLTLKSKVRFVPGGMKPFDIKNASGESLWSQRDELLVRLVCYAFSVSPTPFVHQTNRATANASQEQAEEEGLFQLMSYWKDDVMDTIIQKWLGEEEVEFLFLPRPEPDQTKQSKIHQVQLQDGSRTINEIRGELGLEPVPDGDYHLIYTGAAVFRLDQVVSGEAMMQAPGSPQSNPGEKPTPPAPTASSKAPVRGSAPPRSTSTGQPQETKPTPVHKTITAEQIAEAAARALRNPDKLDRMTGAYRKGHISLYGLKIAIENAKGSERGEKDHDGKWQSVKMPCPYGYIKGTKGADNMQVDCYLGKHPEDRRVFVIDQDKYDVENKDKGFDEHKVMLGFRSKEKAIKAYLRSHYDDLGHERLAAITEITVEALKRWLKKGDMNAPISEQGVGIVVGRRGEGGGIEKADTISQGTNLLNYSQLEVRRKKRRKKIRPKRDQQGPRWLNLCA